MGYRGRQVDRYRKEGSSRPGVVGDIVNRMACEREEDAGLGNPWWMKLKVESRGAYKEGG